MQMYEEMIANYNEDVRGKRSNKCSIDFGWIYETSKEYERIVQKTQDFQ